MKNGCFQISVTHVCQELPLHVLCVFYQLLRGTWLPEWHKAFPKIPPAFSVKTRAWQYPQVASQGLKSEVQSLTWRQIKFFMGLQKLYWGQGYRWLHLETHSRALCRNGFLQCCSWDEISSCTHLISSSPQSPLSQGVKLLCLLWSQGLTSLKPPSVLDFWRRGLFHIVGFGWTEQSKGLSKFHCCPSAGSY